MKAIKNIGIIGAGARALGLGKDIIYSDYNLRVTAIYDKYDKRMEEVKSMLDRLSSNEGKPSDIKLYSNYKELVDDESIDLVMVTTPSVFS